MNQSSFGFSNEGNGSGGGSNINKPLNLSDTTIYDVVTKKITIPIAILTAGIYTCEVDLYIPAKSYNINDIVRSDGTNGGQDKLCYKSITNGNVGNLLSDITNWVFADDLGGNVGNIEVATFGNPNSLSSTHNSAFRINTGTFAILFKRV